MIRIAVFREGDRHTLVLDGHANAAPHGQDIVCAAVSAIYQTALMGLALVARRYPSFVVFDDATATDSAAGSAHHHL